MDKTNIEYVLPEEIEKRSFEIIAAELAERGITLPAEQDPVTRRVIHTSADFDYAETMTYSENAVEIAKNLIKNGADIVTDTNMALAGINKKVLASFGGEAHCYMADADVAAMAKERKTTRAAISMELASKLKKPVIFAACNAPTVPADILCPSAAPWDCWDSLQTACLYPLSAPVTAPAPDGIRSLPADIHILYSCLLLPPHTRIRKRMARESQYSGA